MSCGILKDGTIAKFEGEGEGEGEGEEKTEILP